MPTEKKHPDPTEKKRSPVPSPKFVQARLRRDIRLLDERRQKLTSAHNEKMRAIEAEMLDKRAELRDVTEKLEKAGHAEAKGGE